MRFVLVALATALAATAQPVPLPNASFDEADAQGAVTGWTQDSGGLTKAAFARDTDVKHSGAASVRLTCEPEGKRSWPAWSASLKVEPGQCYQVAVWIRTQAVDGLAYLATDYLNAAGQRVSFSSGGAANGTVDWRRCAVTATIPAGAATMSVRLILYGTGTAWFDDLTIARDEAYERNMTKLNQPLPSPWVDRATPSVGDLGRLRRLFAAAAQGGAYTFGVIGGSITAGASASSADAQYSGWVLRWLREHYPKAQWTFVNAGIGATGTSYGCLRAQRDLLAKAPDLIVSEYAVNDGNTRECAETYEGLLRQMLASAKHPAVILLFMMNRAGGNAQEWQSKLGRHYGLPMLSYRDLLWPEIEAKQLAWTDISPDEVHPNDLGHGYAGKLIATLLDRAPNAAATTVAEALPAPLLTDTYQTTHLFEAPDLKPIATTGWTLDTAPGRPAAWHADQPGSTIEFEVTGEQLFLSFWRIRGAMGRARVTIDGGNATVQEGWFDQTWGGYRCMVQLPTGAPGAHRVKLELLPDKAADSTGHEFRLVCLGTAGR